VSHIVEAKTSVVNPDQELLRQATELVAQQNQGRIESFYIDWNRRQHACPLAIFTRDLRRGIGITVDAATGALTFVGDPYGIEEIYQKVQQEVLQMYVSLATMKALSEMGYTTQALDGEQAGQVVVQGVSYA
jgi:hypothetical protein